MLDSVISAGRYRLGRPLGRGGMAQVRLGLDVSTGHAVAVKYLTGELVADEHARQLFASEVEAASALDHPGVVRVLDSGEADDLVTGEPTPYLVMEFVPGYALTALTCRRQPVTTEKSLALTRHLLEALAHCHDAGLIHGDIKPANVMVMPTGGVKLMDFGLSSRADGASDDSQVMPRFLTIRYASPEQVRQAPTDARSDLYSVGCVLYELLTGQPPFSGEPEKVFAHHLLDRPAPPSTYNPDVGLDVDAIVLRALEKSPDDRYPSAAAMVTDIDRVVEANMARSNVSALPEATTVDPAAELPYWPALTALARTREARRHRFIRSVSGVAAALLPIAGFGLLHVRGNGDVGGASAAVALGGVVQPRVGQARDAEVAPLETPGSPGGVAGVRVGLGSAGAAVLLGGAPVSVSPTSVVAVQRSMPAAAGDDSLGTAAPDAPARPRRQEPGPGGPEAPGPDGPKPGKPVDQRAPVKPEGPKTDKPAAEKPKPGKPADKPKPDKPKPDKPKPDKPKPDKPKPEKPKAEKPKPEKPKAEKPKPEKPKPEKPEKPKPEKPKPEKPKPEKPKPKKAADKPKPDTSETG